MSARRRSIASDLRRVDKTADRAIDYEDSPPLDESFFTRPLADWPPAKQTITIRLDAGVLAWFRRRGRGYQTRINRVLRLFVQGQATARPRRRQATRPRGNQRRAAERSSPNGHSAKK
jgi:uncharacterized protein (DUF4415 family)